MNFALCPGTASAPPLRVYTPFGFKAQLQDQASTFCEHYVKIDIDSEPPRIMLPKVFEWYAEDFGGREQVLLWCALACVSLSSIWPLLANH